MSDNDVVNYIIRYGGSCRDCADNDGVCDDGTPCDPKTFGAVIKRTLKALEYGIKHGFVQNPFASTVPDVSELVRYMIHPLWGRMINRVGEYVLYSQAAEIIAVERANVATLESEIKRINDAIAVKGGTEHSPTQDAYNLACSAIEKHRKCAETERSEKDAITRHAMKLEKANKRYRKALEFYADTSKYPAPLTGGMGDLWSDCGQTAKDALENKE